MFEASRLYGFHGLMGFEGLIVRIRDFDSLTVCDLKGAREFESSEYLSLPSI